MTPMQRAFDEAYETGTESPAPKRIARPRRAERKSAGRAPAVPATASEPAVPAPATAARTRGVKPSAAFVAAPGRPTLPERLFNDGRTVEQLLAPTGAVEPPRVVDAAPLAQAPAAQVEDLAWLEAMNRAAAGLDQHVSQWNPALEVPHLVWPQTTLELLEAADDDVCRLLEMLTTGQPRRVVVAGGGAGAVCTTTTLMLAYTACTAGRSVALVDGDFANASLAAQLGLRVEQSWIELLHSDLPPGEVLIESLADRAVVAPLVAPIARPEALLASPRLAQIWHELIQRFDLVLVDAGSLSRGAQVAALVGAEAPAELLFVQDTRRAAASELNHARRCFPNLRACPTKIAQNFVRE